MNFLKCAVRVEDHHVHIHHDAFAVETDDKKIVARLEPSRDSGEIVLGIRPEDVNIYLEEPREMAISAEVYVTEPLGSETIVDVKLGENVIKVLADPDFPGNPGQKIWVNFNSSRIHFFHAQSNQCLFHASHESPLQISQSP
jgi:multiple sugar transport system ATP-binding protein